MCGIAGFVTPDHIPESKLELRIRHMGRALAHRGPDGEGYWCDESSGAALGHRRLSIVDLSSAGAQPMQSRCDRLVMAYNGEVYNAPEISKELEKFGATFQGSSDTEVILEGFSHWGIEKTLEKMIGMFAIALWNKQTKELFLIRDRLGIKPLYWTLKNGGLIFASELKALRAHPHCSTSLSDSAIADFLRKGFISGSSAIYENVFKLLPGKLLRFKLNAEPKITTFWSFPEIVKQGKENQFEGDIRDTTERLRELVTDAVKKRMISDVPLGSFLSGGIDSSLVAAIMQRESSKQVRTFSVGFNEAKYNEAPHAAAVAKHIGSDHTEMYVSSEDAFNVIPDLPIIYDEPFSDPSQIPTFLLCKLTREHVTVALSGDGGDELFAGYDRYFTTSKFTRALQQPKLLRDIQAKIVESISPVNANRLSRVLPAKVGKHLSGHKLERISPALRDGRMSTLYNSVLSHKQLTAEVLNSQTNSATPVYESLAELGLDDNISQMQYIDTMDYLPCDILTKVDRASMAASLEARVPLIDHRIVEFSWRLPNSHKISDGVGKHILRELLYQYVPKELIDRPKMGFSVPIGLWLKGPLKAWAEDLLSEASLQSTDVFNTKYVQTTWTQHQKGQVNWEYHLWDILNLQSWLLKNQRADALNRI